VTVYERFGSDAQSATGDRAILTNRWRRLPIELLLLFSMFVAYRAGRLLTSDHTSAAFANAQELWHVERWLRLPHEAGLQDWILQSVPVTELANSYYAIVHFPVTVGFLIWMFLRRPAHYLWVRRSIVLLTASALVMHVLFPLAPPRMRPDLGFVDTGAVYGPNVYGQPQAGSIANQFAAMPSLHVGWAVLVAIGLIMSSRTRWRWLWLAHPVITVLVVVSTANHWWLDGLLAVALLGGAMAVASLTDRVHITRFLRRARRTTSSA
jgi:PAP2 superfamily